MSLHPELPYVGSPVERLFQKASDQDRSVNKALVKYDMRITRGFAVVTFTASNQATTTVVTVPSWTTGGILSGVATADLVGLVPCICTITDNLAGTATIRTFTYNGTNVTGSVQINYEVWPSW